MKLGLEGRTAIVTGGSKGIGLETARLLAEEGAKVMICARRESALAEARADIESTTGVKVETHSLDVTDLAQIKELPAVAKERLGRIDMLVNNAGTGTYKPFLEVTDDELQYGMAINFFAQFRICQRIIPLMIEQKGGAIVNVAGETGIMVTMPPFLSSCTGPAKSAEIRFSKILANEFGPHNIRVNCVVPGFVTTPERFAKWERELAKRELSPEEADAGRRLWSENNAMRNTRWGTPEELANLIVFALSGRASFVNGAVLVADNAMDKS
ncbi:SDR family NAD(P)-dependent oxidoreductase [Chelatococcus asaccharovorans]|uniref:SDR family NAD(P)-dependent oxidoreductase n=1 Tax=Chelatococcus asaccharovorans TaxID=28210 RepID=UPI00224C74C3|nr:SDR family oxidoreductase [Chelatococcus asaccharovorans]CAH1663433.1 3-oxoacyl-(acyl-carrier protein) reductase [Chelatococcus asaccharovorans]CAH1682797.1 3-oxoacyl-(acyl-carrier protein) reductase [Chelatococcus asaccharovorans]